jgi:hypothetical protein
MAVLRGNLFNRVPDRTMTISSTPMTRAQIAKVMVDMKNSADSQEKV